VRQHAKVTSTDDLLPDLYRRYVMEDCSSPVRSTTSIESFENCNLLRYGEQDGAENEEVRERPLGA
jgi:hypothetical protein